MIAKLSTIIWYQTRQQCYSFAVACYAGMFWDVQKLPFYVHIAVAAIFDFITEENWAEWKYYPLG